MAHPPPRPPRPTALFGGLTVEPPPSTPSDVEVDVIMPTLPPSAAAAPLAELDSGTRDRIADAIARAITAELGRVRISSIAPPPSEPPRSSMRAAAKSTSKLGKWGTMALGALALIGQIIVWVAKPEFAGPIVQAVKLIASLAGGEPSSGEVP